MSTPCSPYSTSNTVLFSSFFSLLSELYLGEENLSVEKQPLKERDVSIAGNHLLPL